MMVSFNTIWWVYEPRNIARKMTRTGTDRERCRRLLLRYRNNLHAGRRGTRRSRGTPRNVQEIAPVQAVTRGNAWAEKSDRGLNQGDAATLVAALKAGSVGKAA
ncbi:hypothetical protein Psi02_70510 [Planotetraspora silvatica]|uniref:Uncharacterized protein n=1 Tax=Planotetraspora silvatica TaxID=234614 RepID=A0A8J3USQ5_9ACTN|nr:hypothetical protein Psi02_70510 [Planotetraspora silvatica]